MGFIANAIEYFVYAGWHGYFLIIAMQFYMAYWLFTRFQLWRLNPVPWLWGSCVISMAYWGLAYWLGIDLPGYLLWVAPLGWIYVFFLALVLVRYYPLAPESVLALRPTWMQRLAQPVWLALLVALIIAGTFAGQLAFSSKEVWVIPFFVLFTLCAMRYLAGRPVPVWVRHVNAHSFGIYLAHPMFFVLADLAVAPLALPVVVYALVLIVVGIVGSVALNKLANTFTLGAMLFGKQLKVA